MSKSLWFKAKLILWGREWNPPSSSFRVPLAAEWPDPPTATELAIQQRYTYAQWLASGKASGMTSTYTALHPTHEHKHSIHVWGEQAFYDPEDPRPQYDISMGWLPDMHPDSTSPEAVEFWSSTGG